jgi:hypothetical protein
MALEIARNAPDGSVRTYHRIVKVEADLIGYEFSVQVGSYRDADARGVAPFYCERETFQVEAGQIEGFDIEGNLVATLYGWLKTQPEWEGANDV